MFRASAPSFVKQRLQYLHHGVIVVLNGKCSMNVGYYYLVVLGSWGRPWEVVQGSQSDKAPPVVSHPNSSRERLLKADSSLFSPVQSFHY